MIDWSRIRELRAEIGEDGLAEVVEMFLDEVEQVVMRLREKPEPERLEEDLHFLKGGAWNLGFAEFGAQCQHGERLAAAGRAGEVDVAAVTEAYFASKQVFLEGLAGGAESAAGSAA
ncbi:Hpt domain-containing protein [Albidovulum sp.]